MRLIPEGLLERAAARWRSERFADARDGLRRRAGALLAVDLEPPDEPAGLFHYRCDRAKSILGYRPDRDVDAICAPAWTGTAASVRHEGRRSGRIGPAGRTWRGRRRVVEARRASGNGRRWAACVTME